MVEIKVLIREIDKEYIDENFEDILSTLDFGRREQVLKLKNKSAVYSSVTAGMMLKEAFENIYGGKDGEIMIEKGDHGKPFIKNKEEFKYNISHSGKYVILAYSNDENVKAIGADVECIRKKDDDMRIAHRFFTAHETDYISNSVECSDEDVRFYKVWTMKEAYIKLLGTGLATRLDSFSVDPDELIVLEKREDISFDMKLMDGYVFTICSYGDIRVVYL